MKNLQELGWNDVFERHFEPFREQGLLPARIAVVQKQTYFIYTENGDGMAKLSGKFRYHAHDNAEYPAIGDWVVMRPGEPRAIIQALLPRKNSLTRRTMSAGGTKFEVVDGQSMLVSGSTQEQVIAANIDTMFIVMGLDADFNLQRIERFLTFLHNRKILPVIVLNKADLCSDIDEHYQKVRSITENIPIHVVSALEHQGLDALQPYLIPGKTTGFLGSSGVGKSTIINRLLGQERQKTGAVNEMTGRGRHVTTHRELIALPSGGMLIDNPGIRALKLWAEEEDVRDIFRDIEALFEQCRFRNCSHTAEPGCAVQEALEDGTLDPHRYKSYRKQTREVRHLARRKQAKRQYESKQEREKLKEKDDYRIFHQRKHT
jgi:ribosome biogenesis GTPase / thiamine phosphate phosphatase